MIPITNEKWEESIIPGNVGKNIRIHRQMLGMTQQELADKIGVTKAAISRYEKNLTKKINLETKIALASALRCSLHDLADEDEIYDTTQENKLYVQAGKDAMKYVDDLMDFKQYADLEIMPLGDVIIPTKHLNTKRYIIIDKRAWDNADVETLNAFINFMAQRAAAKDNAKRRAATEWEMNEEKEILKKANNKEGDTNEKP